MRDLTGAAWRKSTRSSNNNACVEVARNLPDVIGVRDSKDQHGPALGVAPTAWSTFLDHLRTGNIDA